MSEFMGLNAVVTGAGRGIGRATAELFAMGAATVVAGRNLQLQNEFRAATAAAPADRHGMTEPDDATVMAAASAQTVMHLAFVHWASLDGATDIGDELRSFFDLANGIIRRSK